MMQSMKNSTNKKCDFFSETSEICAKQYVNSSPSNENKLLCYVIYFSFFIVCLLITDKP